jgi:hypothetical protein
MDYGKKLEALGLSDVQIVTILSGWSIQGIEALLRGELTPPSQGGIMQAVMACGAD